MDETGTKYRLHSVGLFHVVLSKSQNFDGTFNFHLQVLKDAMQETRMKQTAVA
jgi:hypothetical protein